MLNDPEPAASAPASAAPVTAEASIEDFVLTLHRFSMTLGEADLFGRHKVDLSEWAILKALEPEKTVPVGQLERNTGLSRQRIRTHLAQLEKKGLVTVLQSVEGDKRIRTVTASPRAGEVTSVISADLASLVGEGKDKDGKRAKRVLQAGRLAKQLARLIKGRNPRHKRRAGGQAASGESSEES